MRQKIQIEFFLGMQNEDLKMYLARGIGRPTKYGLLAPKTHLLAPLISPLGLPVSIKGVPSSVGPKKTKLQLVCRSSWYTHREGVV